MSRYIEDVQGIIDTLDKLDLRDIGVETRVDEPEVTRGSRYDREKERTIIFYPCFQQNSINWQYDATEIPHSTKVEVLKRVRDLFQQTGQFGELYSIGFAPVEKGYWDLRITLE